MVSLFDDISAYSSTECVASRLSRASPDCGQRSSRLQSGNPSRRLPSRSLTRPTKLFKMAILSRKAQHWGCECVQNALLLSCAMACLPLSIILVLLHRWVSMQVPGSYTPKNQRAEVRLSLRFQTRPCETEHKSKLSQPTPLFAICSIA